jgi:hypothetical protein
MPRSRSLYPVILAMMAALSFASLPGATAQPEKSPNELRVENDRLRETIDRLRADNERLEATIASQEELITQLRGRLRELSEQRSSPAAPAAASANEVPAEEQREMADTPDDPLASPESMCRHLTSLYAENIGDDVPGNEAEAARKLRDVRAWSRGAVRDTRGVIEWRIRVVSLADSGSGVECDVDVIDEASGLPIGDSFPIQIVGRNAARLRAQGADAEWILDGRLRGDIRVDESVLSVTDVNEGWYLGPYAIFDFDVQVTSLRTPN